MNGIESLNGLLPMVKPSGITSYAVIRQIRQVIGGRHKVGHGGTLDPQASGVLVLGLGRGTKVLGYCLEFPKTYRAEVVFGLATDTQDLSGRIRRLEPGTKLSPESVIRATEALQGEISQIPPMVSALHYRGRRMYQWAREGATVPRAPRTVVIYRLAVLDFLNHPLYPRAIMEVECSSGTYVRSLADTLGDILGCGATLGFLVRIRVGEFGLHDCFSVDEVRCLAQGGRLREALRSPDVILKRWPAIQVNLAEEVRLAQGQKVFLAWRSGQELASAELCRIYGADGKLLGIGRASLHQEQVVLHMKTMLR